MRSLHIYSENALHDAIIFERFLKAARLVFPIFKYVIYVNVFYSRYLKGQCV